MKYYKTIGLVACIATFLVLTLLIWLTPEESYRYHQHLESLPKEACEHGEDVFCTHLPLVKLETNGIEVPGKPVYEEETGRLTGYTTAEDGSATILARMEIVDHEFTNNHPDDAADIDSAVYIRVRGNTSREFDKFNYAIRLVNEAGENNPQSVMGMDAHHEWVLHGPFLDKTLMRNYMWYNISGEIMDYAPNVRFCEIMLNGEYIGVYVMEESITAGKDGARLDLFVNKENNMFGGYLLRLDRGSDDALKKLNNFSNYTYRITTEMNIVYPGIENLTEQLQKKICRDFSDFEKTLYSYDFMDGKHGYEQYIDVASFVDYFLINELTCNYDAGKYSTYIYKPLHGKYRMCIWDMNSACDNYRESMTVVSRFELQDAPWYFMLTKDEDFIELLISRYYELRKTYFDEEYLMNYIDDVAAYLGDAIDRNYEVWGYTFNEKYDKLIPKERNPRSYDEAVEDMKTFLHNRIAWMDENIEILRQYSAESKVKKFIEHKK